MAATSYNLPVIGRLIVVGSAGYIGSRLWLRASEKCEAIRTTSDGREGSLKVDLAAFSPSQVSFINSGDVVALTAAISSPDFCSRNPVQARQVNIFGTKHLIEAACSQGANVIFFSSDTVYGEAKDPVDESYAPDPVGSYAEMKREVELSFEGDPRVKVLRLSFVFARNDKFTSYLEKCSRSGEKADIFHPFLRSIVYREDVIDAVLTLAENWNAEKSQIVNCGGPELLSRAQFADTLKEVALPPLEYIVTKPDADFFKSRPGTINMHSPILAKLLGRQPVSLRAAAEREFKN